jgi:hypothetical protein
MATMVGDKVRVGQVVYRSYTPVMVGVVVEILSAGDGDAKWPRVRVEWDNKKRGTTEEPTLGLADYEALVEEHERKAANHRAILNRIKLERVRAAVRESAAEIQRRIQLVEDKADLAVLERMPDEFQDVRDAKRILRERINKS